MFIYKANGCSFPYALELKPYQKQFYCESSINNEYIHTCGKNTFPEISTVNDMINCEMGNFFILKLEFSIDIFNLYY